MMMIFILCRGAKPFQSLQSIFVHVLSMKYNEYPVTISQT